MVCNKVLCILQNPPDWNPGKTVGKIVIILLKLLEFILYILRAWHHLPARNFRPAIYTVWAMYIMLAALKWVQVLICNLGSCVFLFMGRTPIIVKCLERECSSAMSQEPRICLQTFLQEILTAALRLFHQGAWKARQNHPTFTLFYFGCFAEEGFFKPIQQAGAPLYIFKMCIS